MSRWFQTWMCQTCGHTVERTVTYPKYGGSEAPLALLERRSRCSVCGLRGTAKITEVPVPKIRSWRQDA